MDKSRILELLNDISHTLGIISRNGRLSEGGEQRGNWLDVMDCDAKLNLIIAALNKDWQVCEQCGSTAPSVKYRPNNFSREINGIEDAMWVACDDCDYNNTMDI